MKKSEILESCEKVESYYRIEGTKILIIYVQEIDWKHIEKWGKQIIDISASVKGDYCIRVSVRVDEWD